jgi:hypothetical protein
LVAQRDLDVVGHPGVEDLVRVGAVVVHGVVDRTRGIEAVAQIRVSGELVAPGCGDRAPFAGDRDAHRGARGTGRRVGLEHQLETVHEQSPASVRRVVDVGVDEASQVERDL